MSAAAPLHKGPPAPLRWTLLGISAVYLSHFASMYPQLPGLYGDTGLQPVTDASRLLSDTWVLQYLPPQLGMEIFTACGILIAGAQLALGSSLRYGLGGMAAFSLEWIAWHDLVYAGGRFTGYQMVPLIATDCH